MSQRIVISGVCLFLFATGWWILVHADEQPKPASPAATAEAARPAKKSAELMRKKLGAAQDILEGLTTEDYELIRHGAASLRTLAGDAGFLASKDSMYVQHVAEFKSLATKLEEAAASKSLDKASLHYVGLTMNCLECHRFVRDVLIAR